MGLQLEYEIYSFDIAPCNGLQGAVAQCAANFMGGQDGVVGPRFESQRGHYVDWVFSPYLTAWVSLGFPGIILWGFPPPSKTEISSSYFLLLGSNWSVENIYPDHEI